MFQCGFEIISTLRKSGNVLMPVEEIKHQFSQTAPDLFSADEPFNALLHCFSCNGTVWRLNGSDQLLLQPEYLLYYANSIIQTIRAHREGIGCIPEASLLDGQLTYSLSSRLQRDKEALLLRRLCHLFVDRKMCLKQDTQKGTMLVFPSYFRLQRPSNPEDPSQIITYQFSGPPEEIFCTLIAQLHHTEGFTLGKRWHLAADFYAHEEGFLGVRLDDRSDHAGVITIYFDLTVSDDTKLEFVAKIHEHLLMTVGDLIRIPSYACPHCSYQFEDQKSVKKRAESSQKKVICPSCDKRVGFKELIDGGLHPGGFLRRVRELEEDANICLDAESIGLILVGEAMALAAKAGQIFRPANTSDWGIDGEIEFKDHSKRASGRLVKLQLKSGNSYLYDRRRDGTEVFYIKNAEHPLYWLKHWQNHKMPVMLVTRSSDGIIRWMDITQYLLTQKKIKGKWPVKEIIFQGEPFTHIHIRRMRDRYIPPPC